MGAQLDALLGQALPSGTKGLPTAAEGVALGQIQAQGLNVLNEDLPLPLAVIKQSALLHNADWMKGFLDQRHMHLAPHGKTTMCPQLFELQMQHGAWGITVATVQQLKVCRRFGIGPVLMANQLLGKDDIRYVAGELARDPSFEFYCLVDSNAGVARLEHQLGDISAKLGKAVTLRVLVELGLNGGRTGCRDIQQVLDVATAIRSCQHLALHGLECYEGGLVSNDAKADAQKVDAFMQRLVEVFTACQQQGVFADPKRVLMTAGGSAYFDLVAKAFTGLPMDIVVPVIRSGCYLTHDSQFYRNLINNLEQRCVAESAPIQTPGLQSALEVWAYVQSVPEPGLAIINLGKRDISHDIHLPVVEQWYRPGFTQKPQVAPEGIKLTALNDQHGYLQVPAEVNLAVGDMVSLGISHPCTTFDKWQLLWLVDDNYQVVSGLRTFF